MAERGGYRKPTKGAQVSPPGALSQRKERENVKNTRQDVFGMGGYGSTKEAKALASSAEFAGKTPTPKIKFNPALMMQGMPSLLQETQRPDEAPEEGMNFGAGSSAIQAGGQLGAGMAPSPQKEDLAYLSRLVPMIKMHANKEGAPKSLRALVNLLESNQLIEQPPTTGPTRGV